MRNKELLDDAVAKGAHVAAGGEFNGTVVSATVLDRVTPACASTPRNRSGR